MNNEKLVSELMSYGLSEVQAVDAIASRSEKEINTIMEFLRRYK